MPVGALTAYGAVVSTLVAAWNIFREVTDGGRLRVQVVNIDAFHGAEGGAR
jgi:hypothetical protein